MSGVVTATINYIDNSNKPTPMDAHYELLSIDVIREINKIPTAQLVLLDGNAAQQKFTISDGDFFKLGNKIEIKLGYEDNPGSNHIVFTGFVITHGIRVNSQKSILTLHLKNVAIQLTQQRKNAIFRELDDVAIIKKIVEQYSEIGVTLGTFDLVKSAITPPEMVQYYCTDWDFILSRAEANGLWVMAKNGELNIHSPKKNDKENSFEITYGLDKIYDLEMESDIHEQFEGIEVIALDLKEESFTNSQSAEAFSLEQSNLDPTTIGKNIGAEKLQLISGTQLTPEEAKAWANAKLKKHRLSMIKGRILVSGRGDIQLGNWLELKQFSNCFNGKTLITGIRHQVSEAGWQTDIQFGASADFFARTDDIVAPPASGLLPAVHGLQVGVVGEATEDPAKLFRVPVQMPRLLDDNNGTIWARLATPEAGLGKDGKGRGMMFRPELGDEVILGFLDDDPRQAIILGSLYSEKNKTPIPVTQENMERGIFTKEGLKLSFNDKDKSIRLETSGKNCIVINDTDESIEIIDQHSNKFTMNSDGIEISSDKDISITANGNITLKGSKVDVQ